MSGYLITAYVLTFVLIFGYVAYLSSLKKDLRRRLEDLQETTKTSKPGHTR